MHLFPCCGAHEGNSNGKIVHHRLVRLAMKHIVAQFCRAKDHEIFNEGTECVRLENVMQFLHNHQLDTSLPPHSQSLSQCYRWPVGS